MKLFMTILFISISSFASTPLDVEFGYWEYKADMDSNPIMRQAMAGLALLPKEQQEMLMKKIGLSAGTQTFKKCFTKEDMKEWEGKINNEYKKEGCKIVVKRSTTKIYEAVRKCKNKIDEAEILLEMNDKKSGNVTIKMGGAPMDIKSKLTWLSNTCPKG